jgi:prophage regulatory protein
MKKMAVVEKNGLEYIPNIDRMIREKECLELTTLANSTR